MNDNAAMLNMNTSPTITARIPIMILNAVNPDTINAIPKNTKLNPMNMDKVAVLSTGQIIKINPKIIDNIPETEAVFIDRDGKLTHTDGLIMKKDSIYLKEILLTRRVVK